MGFSQVQLRNNAKSFKAKNLPHWCYQRYTSVPLATRKKLKLRPHRPKSHFGPFWKNASPTPRRHFWLFEKAPTPPKITCLVGFKHSKWRFKTPVRRLGKIIFFEKNGFRAGKNGTFLRVLRCFFGFFGVDYGDGHGPLSPQKSHLGVGFSTSKKNFRGQKKAKIGHFGPFWHFFWKIENFKIGPILLKSYSEVY